MAGMQSLMNGQLPQGSLHEVKKILEMLKFYFLGLMRKR